MRRNRYQEGSVQLDPRTNVWYYRWTEKSTGTRKAKRLGTLAEIPNKTAARKASEGMRLAANSDNPRTDVTFRAVVQRYKEERMPKRYSTSRSYLSYIDGHILPKWGDMKVSAIKQLAVENWLVSLPLAFKTKNHIRGLMHKLFQCAMLWEILPLAINPISLINLRAEIEIPKQKRILSRDEFQKLLTIIPEEPFNTMLLVAMCLGLRCSELLGMKWSDFDWKKGEVLIQRAVVSGRQDVVKTKYSMKPVPISEELAVRLLLWRSRSAFNSDSDWVWASPYKGGEMPLQGWGIQHNKIVPASRLAGLGDIGWHDLRHTYRTWLGELGTPISVQKDLMRHSDIKTTMNIYGGSLPESMRLANMQIAKMALPN